MLLRLKTAGVFVVILTCKFRRWANRGGRNDSLQVDNVAEEGFANTSLPFFAYAGVTE